MMTFFYKMKRLILKRGGVDNSDLAIAEMRKLGSIVGERVRFFSDVPRAEPYLIEIGDDTTVAPNVMFITHDNSIYKLTSDYSDTVGKIRIGKKCFIGRGAIILPGVTIADSTIVGAGAVVTKSVEREGVIIGGNPAKVIGSTANYYQKIALKKTAFNFKGLSYEEKKHLILSNPDKWIER